MSDQPNVLLVCTDQQQAGALGVADDTFVTPTLDRLAEDGVRSPGVTQRVPSVRPPGRRS